LTEAVKVKLKTLYRHQKSAWMDTTLCQHWVDNVFTKYVRRYIEGPVVILWDNFSAHLKVTPLDPDIMLLTLPPNLTSVYQPMDQGIISAIKRRYRSRLMTFAFRMTSGVEIFSLLQEYGKGKGKGLKMGRLPDIVEAIELCSEIWVKNINRITIVNCFRKANCLGETQQAELRALSELLAIENEKDICSSESCDSVANEIVAACAGATLPRKLERVVGKSIVFEAETSTEEKVVQVARWLDLEESAEVQEMEHENALMELLTLRVSKLHVDSAASDSDSGDESDAASSQKVCDDSAELHADEAVISEVPTMTLLRVLTRRFAAADMEDCCGLLTDLAVAFEAAEKVRKANSVKNAKQTSIILYFGVK
jgi:hypothetical protein